jgi:hypothetical protein
MSGTVTARARLWRWEGGGAAWHFLTIAGEAAEAIAAHEAMRRLEIGKGRGFGSVKVTARIGASRWATSVFPHKQDGYLLPVKAAIRRDEGIADGDEVEVELKLL